MALILPSQQPERLVATTESTVHAASSQSESVSDRGTVQKVLREAIPTSKHVIK